MRQGPAIAAIVALLCAAVYAQDDIIYRAYQLKTRPRPAVLTVLQQLAGERGKVIDDTAGSGKLMILATSNAHEQVAALLAETDVPVRNVRIDITTTQAGSQNESGFEVRASGTITATRQGTGYRVKVTPRVVDDSMTQNSIIRQSIVVADGEEGSLVVAEEVPNFEWIWEIGRSWGYIPRDMVIREVGAFLDVQPQINPDGRTINVRLTPELRGLSGNKPARIRYTKASTQLTVQNGATMTIGALGRDSEFSRKFLVGRNRSGQAESVTITLTPRIMGADGTTAP